MKWYPSDWRGDQALRICSLAARGLWIEMINIMHESVKPGHLLINGKPVTETQLALLTGAPSTQVKELIDELEAAGVFSRNRDGVIYSRRMTRDHKRAQTARKNGRKGGNPKLGKQRRISDWDNPPDKPPDKGHDKPQRPEAINQKESGTRVERRSLRPGGTDPPTDQPDPKKFTMFSDWRMPGELQDELMAAFLSDLGEQAFWRQIGRFVEHHAEQGSLDTEGGFAELLRGWLERANANRESPKPAGAIAPETSAKPLTDEIVPTLDLEEFRNRVFRLYDDSLAAKGKRRMNTLEMGRFKMAADQLKIGKVQSIGVERGETWAIADVLRLLGLSKREAA